MAKHYKGKTVSHASRISCKPNVKAVSPVPAVYVFDYTNIRNAFFRAAGRAYNEHVDDCLRSDAGVSRTGRGWNAELSGKTVQQLVKTGVFA